MKNQDSSAADDQMEQFKRLWEKNSTSGHWNTQHTYPAPQPCPDCGRCPTCGRRGRYTITYGYPGYFYQDY